MDDRAFAVIDPYSRGIVVVVHRGKLERWQDKITVVGKWISRTDITSYWGLFDERQFVYR